MRGDGEISDIPVSLPKEQQGEALQLRNKLLLYRFRNLSKLQVDASLRQTERSGRFNQIVMPLLAVTEGDASRERIINFAKRCDDKLPAVRQASLDAATKRAYEELSAESEKPVSVASIADLVRERLDDYERPITNKLVGSVLRHELGLNTWKTNGVYLCSRVVSPEVPISGWD